MTITYASRSVIQSTQTTVPGNMALIDVVIVNWNAGHQLKACVASVLEYGADSVARLIVVDNGSTDGSIGLLGYRDRVQVIEAHENLGFGRACNIGAAAGEAPYLLFLNPDTRIESGSISEPLAFMERPDSSDIGICGIQLVDETGAISRTCARFPSLVRLVVSAFGINKLPGFRGAGMAMAEWPHSDLRGVDQVMGAFFLTRRKLFEVLDGFDERFFVYFEEVDFSFRANKSGLRSVYLANARAFHAGGGTSRQVKAQRLFYFLRSRLLYAFKHFPRWQGWLLVGVTGLLEPITRTIWCSLRRDWTGIRNTWSAYRMLWRGMGRIVQSQGQFLP